MGNFRWSFLWTIDLGAFTRRMETTAITEQPTQEEYLHVSDRNKTQDDSFNIMTKCDM